MTNEEYNHYKFLLDITQFIIDNWKWIFAFFLGGGVGGIYVENKFQITTRIRSSVRQKISVFSKLPIIAVFIGSHNNKVGHTLGLSSSESALQHPDISVPGYTGPLSRKQKEICQRVKRVSAQHSESIDPQLLYEKAIKELNLGEIELAAGTHTQLFRKIISALEGVAISNNASSEISNLITVTNGLQQMIQNQATSDELKKQIDDCERTVFVLLTKMPT